MVEEELKHIKNVVLSDVLLSPLRHRKWLKSSNARLVLNRIWKVVLFDAGPHFEKILLAEQQI